MRTFDFHIKTHFKKLAPFNFVFHICIKILPKIRELKIEKLPKIRKSQLCFLFFLCISLNYLNIGMGGVRGGILFGNIFDTPFIGVVMFKGYLKDQSYIWVRIWQ